MFLLLNILLHVNYFEGPSTSMNIYLQTVVYLAPAAIMLGLAVLIISRNARNSQHRTIGLLFSLASLWLFGMFLLHAAPPNHRYSLLLYLIFPTIIATVGGMLHYWFQFCQAYRSRHARWYKLIVLLMFAQIPLIAIDGYAIKQLTYHGEEVTYYPGPGVLVFWILTLGGTALVIRLFVLRHKTDPGPIRIFLTGLVLSIGWGAVMGTATAVFHSDEYPFADLIAHGTLFMLAAVYVNMKKHNYLPDFETRYNILFERSPLGILITDRCGVILEASPIARQTLQLPAASGVPLFDLLPDRDRTNWQRVYFASFDNQSPLKSAELSLHDRDGAARTIALDSEFMVVGAETLQFIMLRDVTELRLQTSQVTYLAYHDQLTGLHNRAAFHHELNRLLEAALPFSLLLMDLNKFKSINDRHGHPAGDLALQFVAKLLTDAAGDAGFVSRLAGDEFVVLLPQPADLDRFLSLVDTGLSQPLVLEDGEQIRVSLSIGRSQYPGDGQDGSLLFKIADERMYVMKHNRNIR